MNKIKLKQSMPSHVKILDFWCSEKGKQILENYNITPYGIHSLTIDAGEECWCCNSFCCEGYYDGWKADKKIGKWYGENRERCHIIAKSLGGSYECENLFLMCNECHRRAPNTNQPRIFFEWVVKTNKNAIQYKRNLSIGMSDIAKELFQPTFIFKEDISTKNEQFKKWAEDISKFTNEFYGEAFTKYCSGKLVAHGYGGRYHPDILNSELGLYKQYCIENKSTLFPNL